jgi:hypothetical protein
MGLFGRKNAPTKAGSYKTGWPKSSGLGVGPYSAESERQEAYLLYTSARRRTEAIPQEDVAIMSEAANLLTRMAGGDPVNEIPLIAGEVDVRGPYDSPDLAFRANAMVTDRRLLLWWQGVRDRRDEMFVFNHVDMVPRDDPAFGVPYAWVSGIATPFPIQIPPKARQFTMTGLVISVHFSSDAQGNRRTESVVRTLREVEARRRTGETI